VISEEPNDAGAYLFTVSVELKDYPAALKVERLFRAEIFYVPPVVVIEKGFCFYDLRFLIGGPIKEFDLLDFPLLSEDNYVEYVSTLDVKNKHWDLLPDIVKMPEELEFLPDEGKYKLHYPEKRTVYNVRLIENQYDKQDVLVDTRECKFSVTFYEPEKAECDREVMIEKLVTDDPNKPIYKLPDLKDPYTGEPLKYWVDIPPYLHPVMSYDPPYINTKTTLLDSGLKPGVYPISVSTECEKNLIHGEITVILRDSESGIVPANCDIDFSQTTTTLAKWVCQLPKI